MNVFTPYEIAVDIDWIVDVKGESSQWTVLMWLSLTWFDNRLAWNESEYNISKISLPGNAEMPFFLSENQCNTKTKAGSYGHLIFETKKVLRPI